MANAKVEKVKKVSKVPKAKPITKVESKKSEVVDKTKYAVVRINGRQFVVHEGEELLVDRIEEKDLKPQVLLLVDGDKVEVGKPILEKVKVKVKVLTELEKGKKVRVFKYKAKSRYRKTRGFRPQYTRLLIENIS